MNPIEGLNVLPTGAVPGEEGVARAVVPATGPGTALEFRNALQQMIARGDAVPAEAEVPRLFGDMSEIVTGCESVQELAAQGGGNLPLSQDHAADPSPAESEDAETFLQGAQNVIEGVIQAPVVEAPVIEGSAAAMDGPVATASIRAWQPSAVVRPETPGDPAEVQSGQRRVNRLILPAQTPQGVERAGVSVAESRGREEWLDALHASIRENLLVDGESGPVPKGAEPVPGGSAEGEPAKPRVFAETFTDPAAESVERAAVLADRGVLSRVREFVQADPQAGVASRSGVPVLDRPLGQSGWAQDLGDRVLWMAGRSVQAADLRLNPPALGPVEVRISLNQDQASIAFSSQHAVVREAIEAAIPKLRDMFAAQQWNLVDINVSHQSLSDQQRQYDGTAGGFARHDAAPTFAAASDADEVITAPGEQAEIAVGDRLVSLYV